MINRFLNGLLWLYRIQYRVKIKIKIKIDAIIYLDAEIFPPIRNIIGDIIVYSMSNNIKRYFIIFFIINTPNILTDKIHHQNIVPFF